MLNRDAILALPFKSEVVATPMGDVRVRVISGAARESYEVLVSGEQQGRIRATWVALTACNDDGSRMFSDSDITALANLDAAFIIPVFEAAMRLNGMAKDSIEEAEKN